MRKVIPILLVIIMSVFGASISQAESNVQIFFVACDTQAVLNFSGSMDAGFDIYYQVYSGAGGTGSTLTNVRRVSVNGTYAVSDQVAYNTGSTVAAGGTASVKVYISREGTSGTGTTPFVVNDVQDGCNSPQNALVNSEDTGGGSTTTTTTGSILSPFGGFINPTTSATPEPIVVIGARTTTSSGRSATPGVIFAECDQYLPGAAPGVLYDNDNIVIFWSWFAKTPEQVQDHIAQAQYDVKLDTAPLVYVNVSPISRPTGKSYWVFYTATIGHLTPGTYGVSYNLTWKQKITDGYDDYGPDTDNESIKSSCTFTISPNPTGAVVTDSNKMYSLQK